MQYHCPFCQATVASTTEAFCFACQNPLDEPLVCSDSVTRTSDDSFVEQRAFQGVRPSCVVCHCRDDSVQGCCFRITWTSAFWVYGYSQSVLNLRCSCCRDCYLRGVWLGRRIQLALLSYLLLPLACFLILSWLAFGDGALPGTWLGFGLAVCSVSIVIGVFHSHALKARWTKEFLGADLSERLHTFLHPSVDVGQWRWKRLTVLRESPATGPFVPFDG